MENKKLLFAAAILATAINIFALGTLIYFAIDVFAIYTENQFTGRVRAFDIDYWNAVGGAAFLIIPARVSAAFFKKLKTMEVNRQAEKFVSEYSDIFDDLNNLDRTVQDGTTRWDPPEIKKPPFFN